MERSPTRTDVIRVCDAAIQFANYWQRHTATEKPITKRIAQRASVRFQQLQDAFKLIPYDCEFFIRPTNEMESFFNWDGWSKPAYLAFLEIIRSAREIHDDNPNLIDGPAWVRLPLIGDRTSRLIETANAFRKAAESPLPLQLMLDLKTCTLTREGKNYRDKAARLGNWFPIIDALCKSGGCLNHADMETAYRTKLTGKYPGAFAAELSKNLNTELSVLDVEIVAVKGFGYEIVSRF
jgi:hypothetical protein